MCAKINKKPKNIVKHKLKASRVDLLKFSAKKQNKKINKTVIKAGNQLEYSRAQIDYATKSVGRLSDSQTSVVKRHRRSLRDNDRKYIGISVKKELQYQTENWLTTIATPTFKKYYREPPMYLLFEVIIPITIPTIATWFIYIWV